MAFLSGILRSWRDHRRRRTDHVAAWHEVGIPDKPDGSTSFQRSCEARLRSLIAQRGLSIVEVNAMKHEHPYICFEVPQLNARFYVYENGAQVTARGFDLILEEWDFRTPEEMIERALNYVRDLPIV